MVMEKGEQVVPGFDRQSLNALGKLISQLERFQLEGAAPEEFDPRDLLEDREQTFFRIRGLTNFWSQNPEVDFAQHMADMVIATHHEQQIDLLFVMIGTQRRLSLYISLGTERTSRTLLEGVFPGIILEPVSVHQLIELLNPYFVAKGVVTGIPSTKPFGGNHVQPGQQSTGHNQFAGQGGVRPAPPQAPPSSLERVIRGMYGTEWAYIVQAHPRPRFKVVEDRMKIIDMLTQVTNRSRVQWQSTTQENQQLNEITSGGTTRTYSGDMVSYRAQYLIQLLERELERLNQGMAAGQWVTRTYFGATASSDARRIASLLLGTLAGTESRPEPLRALLCQPDGPSLEQFYTFLTSQEVSRMLQFPREEVPGYALHDAAKFDVDFYTSEPAALPLGHIQQNHKDTLETFNISLDALTKHAVVIGVTGSGKTTTVMGLLSRMVEASKSFLVIEPAKTEYRSLHRIFSPKTPTRIYTLGSEVIAPFRLNPFEFETNDEPGSASLLTHIDFLKAVFNAAFPLYAPMPQVLETALHEVYEEKGWDLTYGTNRRLADWRERQKYPIFPTLTDLYYKVEEVTERLKYHHEIESNVKAALRARIGSLRIGSKGLMLDTVRGVRMEELLSTPTILELENVGNDDEKTFLMGLFLARLCEYRRLQAATGVLPTGLQHLLVFEEAHRLLQNVNPNAATPVEGGGGNPRAQAVQVFTNMLSEVRAYGQGVLVAEQIPSKLAPDVLKNTNLKIVHRLIASDDRQSIGQTMNLNEQQMMHLGVLEPGMAAVFAEGADHAYLVRMENYKRNISPLVDNELKTLSRRYAQVQPYLEILDLADYEVARAPTGGPDPTLFQVAGKLLDAPANKWLWSNLLLRVFANPSSLFDLFTSFQEQIEGQAASFSVQQQDELLKMLLVRGCGELIAHRGALCGWNYADVENLRVNLTHGLLDLLTFQLLSFKDEQDLEGKTQAAMRKSAEGLRVFAEQYIALVQREQGPFAGCVHCPAKCLYRYDVSTLLTSNNQDWLNRELNDLSLPSAQRYAEAAQTAMLIAQSWVGEEEGIEQTFVAGLGYCSVLHLVDSQQLSRFEQARYSEEIHEHFFPQTSPAAPTESPAVTS